MRPGGPDPEAGVSAAAPVAGSGARSVGCAAVCPEADLMTLAWTVRDGLPLAQSTAFMTFFPGAWTWPSRTGREAVPIRTLRRST